MDIQVFINELGKKFNTDLTLDDQFACSLQVDDVLVNFQYQKYDRTLLLYGLAAYAEEGFNWAQLERALEANLFGYESLTFHLGYYKAMHALVLSSVRQEKDLDVEEFAKLVLVFAEQVKKWEQEIRALADTESNSAQNSAEAKEEVILDINNFLRV